MEGLSKIKREQLRFENELINYLNWDAFKNIGICVPRKSSVEDNFEES